jgi:hypothetical protein
MIIAFAFGLIGALLVLANHKYLRNITIMITAYILTTGLALLCAYFIKHASLKTDTLLFFPMLTPFTALIFLHFTRFLYKRKNKKEIILHMHGFFPYRPDERFVTRSEIYITFIVVILSVIIPYAVLKFAL